MNKFILEFSLAFYLLMNLLLLIPGIFNGWKDQELCNRPLSRIEYVFPGHTIGCWLGDTPK